MGLEYDKNMFDFDSDKFLNELMDNIEDTLRDAIKEFVQVAVSENLIPVDTGMAKGAYLNLGAVLGVNVPINPKPRKNPITYNPYKGSPKMPKNPQSGASLSDYIFSRTDTEIKFYFSTEIYHFILNDLTSGQMINGSPWMSMELGDDAAMEYLEEHLPDVALDISKFLGITNG